MTQGSASSGGGEGILCCNFSPDGTKFVTSSQNGLIRVSWNVILIKGVCVVCMFVVIVMGSRLLLCGHNVSRSFLTSKVLYLFKDWSPVSFCLLGSHCKGKYTIELMPAPLIPTASIMFSVAVNPTVNGTYVHKLSLGMGRNQW